MSYIGPGQLSGESIAPVVITAMSADPMFAVGARVLGERQERKSKRALAHAMALEAAREAAAWAVEERRYKAFQVFFSEWGGMLDLREKVGSELAKLRDRYEVLKRRVRHAVTWPVSFEEDLHAVGKSLDAGQATMLAAPPVSFMSTGAEQEALEEATADVRAQVEGYKAVAVRLREIEISVNGLERRAEDHSRHGRGLYGLGGLGSALLPDGIRYDAMGYASIRRPAGVRYDPLGYAQTAGLGETETPELRELPWQIGVEQGPTKAEVKSARWEKAGVMVGVVGGLLGILIGYRELKSMLEERRR